MMTVAARWTWVFATLALVGCSRGEEAKPKPGDLAAAGKEASADGDQGHADDHDHADTDGDGHDHADGESYGHDHDHDHDRATAPGQEKLSDHGKRKPLGTLTVAGMAFDLVLFGELVPGKEGAFGVYPKKSLGDASLYLWVEDKVGTQLSAPAKGDLEGAGLHFHVLPQDAAKTPSRVVLRVRADGKDERAGLPLDGHGHEH